jgi:hypothetical protein
VVGDLAIAEGSQKCMSVAPPDHVEAGPFVKLLTSILM